jgi:pantoate--beta-alanine ligase
VEVHQLSDVLCGMSRSIHFRGVASVVIKLFNIVTPDIAVFGQKDFQQAVIIRRMVEDLNLDTKIIVGKIVREKDGLAMSSRNTYLNRRQRKNAVVLYDSLRWIKKQYKKGLHDTKFAAKTMKRMIREKDGKIDYIELVDKDTLRPIKKIRRGTLIALAVYFGKTRLIDNIII